MKKIKELTYQDMEELLEHNYDLKMKMIEWVEENACFWLDEYLHDLTGCDYEIDPYGRSYFEINNWHEFNTWFHGVQHDYCFVNDEDAETVWKYIEYAEIYEHLDDLRWYGRCKDKDYYRVEELMEEYQTATEEIILKRLKTEYEWDMCSLVEELDYWFEGNIDDYENAYMTDDYEIYEHIPEHIVEAHDVQIA